MPIACARTSSSRRLPPLNVSRQLGTLAQETEHVFVTDATQLVRLARGSSGRRVDEGYAPRASPEPATKGVLRMATQTKSDRVAAGKKAAATRERNEKKAGAKDQG